MLNQSNITPKGWLAFELSVLRRLKFASAALPFAADANLGAYLKRWNVRVLANDLTLAGWTKAVAAIQNNGETLSEETVNTILEDVYVPRYRLNNESLRNWFNETDSWWFDNVRNNIECLASPITRAVASTIALGVGDYVLSFTEDTRELRLPLSNVYRRLWSIFPAPYNNGQTNVCRNGNAYEFIAEVENRADLMFLRLPRAHNLNQKNFLGQAAWREEFMRGGDDYWNAMEQAQAGRLGILVETKSQYLRLLEETLQTASHIAGWAIMHIEDGFISTSEIVEIISRIRRVDTIYTKDFSEVTGTKAVMITA